MSEQPQAPQEQVPDKKELFKLREKIQLELVNRYYRFPVEDNSPQLKDWIRTYAGDYNNAYNLISKTTPNLIEEYEKDPEHVIEMIEKELVSVHLTRSGAH